MNISADIDARATAVLTFWFERGIVDPPGARRSLDVWFATNTWYDEALRERFADDVVAAHTRDYEHWRAHAESALALLLLTDQIPRNIYRRKPQAFRADAYAQEIARAAIADDLHLGVPFFARLFFFMPFEHAEDLELQDACVAGYRELHAAAAPEWRELTAKLVEAGESHRAVIREFGRFPHRNVILGRVSTPAEQAWCDAHPVAWGQGASVPAADAD